MNTQDNIDDSTIDDKATSDAALREKLTDALILGYQAEFDPEEAEKVGAFQEDALSEQDALDSDVDLVVFGNKDN
jgi:hypothetical protein